VQLGHEEGGLTGDSDDHDRRVELRNIWSDDDDVAGE